MNTELVKEMSYTLGYVHIFSKAYRNTRLNDEIKNKFLLPISYMSNIQNVYKGYGMETFSNNIEDIKRCEGAEYLSSGGYSHRIALELFKLGLLHLSNNNALTFNNGWNGYDSILFDSSCSTWYCGIEGPTEDSYVEMCKEKQISAITRFGKYNLNELKSYYNNIILRFSKTLCYNAVTKKWIIFIPLYLGYADCVDICRGYDSYTKGVFTKSSSKWFINNFKLLFENLFKNDDELSDIDRHIKTIATYILNNYENENSFNIDNESMQNIIEEMNSIIRYYNTYIPVVLKEKSVLLIDNYNPSFETLMDNAETMKKVALELRTSSEDEYRSSYTEYLKECEKIHILSNSKKEAIHPEVEKAIKLLNKFKALNVIKSYDIDLGHNVLVIDTNPLTMDYTLRDDVAKAYMGLNYDNFSLPEDIERHKKYIEESLKDQNIVYVIGPMRINIIFRDSDISVAFMNTSSISCHNYHAEYGGSVTYSGRTYGYNGCRGSFASSFSAATNNRQLTRIISLAIQYVKTFVPLDYAGGKTLARCMIADYRTGEILSSPHTKTIGYDYREILKDNGDLKDLTSLIKVKERLQNEEKEEMQESFKRIEQL